MSNRQLDPADAARVRLATLADEEEIMELCRCMHEETGLMPLSERKVREAIREALNNQGGIIGVIGPPRRIEGCIFLRITQAWYSEVWHIEEFLSFVLPEYRKSGNAMHLIEFAKKCARDIINPETHKALTLFMGITSTERTEAKVRLYSRHFDKQCGALFRYEGAAA